jgi:hypothetical protein
MITLKLPVGSKIVGELLESYVNHRKRLTQDILQVALVSGEVIDVGFSSEGDLSGYFIVVATNGDWDNPIQGPVHLAEPQQVAAVVESWAKAMSQPKMVSQSVSTVSYSNKGPASNGFFVPA